ncbi:hypothetical protein LJC59_09020, partial [Desulfovibrio sp. OttesenSCG-928-A18]|nr:hypothetical protein [Desulfovibrio sp. OttesenSCG-928-A18]
MPRQHTGKLPRPHKGSVLRLLVRTLAGLFLLVLLLVGGALVWLRTSHAERFLAQTVEELLAGQGLQLSLGELVGPLPQKLVLRDIALADAQGPLLRASGLSLRLKLLPLLRGTLEIDELDLEAPELFRLPAPAPSQPEQESSGAFAMPLDIELRSLHVRHGLLHPEALAALSRT